MTYPTLHTGIAGIKYFESLPSGFREAIIQDFYRFDDVKTDYPYLLKNQAGEYEAYRTNPDTWEDHLSSLVQLVGLKRVFVEE